MSSLYCDCSLGELNVFCYKLLVIAYTRKATEYISDCSSGVLKKIIGG